MSKFFLFYIQTWCCNELNNEKSRKRQHVQLSWISILQHFLHIWCHRISILQHFPQYLIMDHYFATFSLCLIAWITILQHFPHIWCNGSVFCNIFSMSDVVDQYFALHKWSIRFCADLPVLFESVKQFW